VAYFMGLALTLRAGLSSLWTIVFCLDRVGRFVPLKLCICVLLIGPLSASSGPIDIWVLRLYEFEGKVSLRSLLY
jgi:hypothetical protein